MQSCIPIECQCNTYVYFLFFFFALLTVHAELLIPIVNNGFRKDWWDLEKVWGSKLVIPLQREDLCPWQTQYLKYNKAQMVSVFPTPRQLLVGMVSSIVARGTGQNRFGTHLMIGSCHRTFSLYCVTEWVNSLVFLYSNSLTVSAVLLFLHMSSKGNAVHSVAFEDHLEMIE